MSIRKRNEYLEADEREDDVRDAYDPHAQEDRRGGIGGASKRRKTDTKSDDYSLQSLGDEEEGIGKASNADATAIGAQQHPETADRFRLGSDFVDEEDVNAPDVVDDVSDARKADRAKSKTPQAVARADKAARKSGVIYISRVPPFMKPQAVRHYLAPHAPKGIGRIFLTPEDHAARLQRVKRGGNKKKSFTDGWVEFISKTEAKIATETLNGNIIGGRKRNFYHDDLWNIKYLKGFKWSNLTEQIVNENAERAARLREEVRKTRKENKAFLEDVERGKMLQGIEGKKKAKQKVELKTETEAVKPVQVGRQFKQRTAPEMDKDGRGTDEIKRIGSMIF